MSEPLPHLLVAVAFGAMDSPVFTVAKVLGSSLMRSLFSGDQMIFHNRPVPLFKSERRQLEEVILGLTLPNESSGERERVRQGSFFRVLERIEVQPRQWVILAGGPGIALRNIDHLLPSEECGGYPPREVDFYWAELGGKAPAGTASPGFWAVRGENLPMVLQHWESALAMAGPGWKENGVAIWSEVVRGLPLAKKRFECGEVVCPCPSSMDWTAVSDAAFVSLWNWPEKESLGFLQALYFGTYLGDSQGTMLNVLEA